MLLMPLFKFAESNYYLTLKQFTLLETKSKPRKVNPFIDFFALILDKDSFWLEICGTWRSSEFI